MFDIEIKYHSEESICTGKLYSEGWLIWLTPKGSSDVYERSIVCHVINDIFNSNEESHGYSWHMLPNRYINGSMNPLIWYASKNDAMNAAMKFIKREITYVKLTPFR